MRGSTSSDHASDGADLEAPVNGEENMDWLPNEVEGRAIDMSGGYPCVDDSDMQARAEQGQAGPHS